MCSNYEVHRKEALFWYEIRLSAIKQGLPMNSLMIVISSAEAAKALKMAKKEYKKIRS